MTTTHPEGRCSGGPCCAAVPRVRSAAVHGADAAAGRSSSEGELPVAGAGTWLCGEEDAAAVGAKVSPRALARALSSKIRSSRRSAGLCAIGGRAPGGIRCPGAPPLRGRKSGPRRRLQPPTGGATRWWDTGGPPTPPKSSEPARDGAGSKVPIRGERERIMRTRSLYF
ncbi:hypothetical protein MRX96_058573 [Rhipicephalus microplus]